MIKINKKTTSVILLILCLSFLFIFQQTNYITVKNTITIFLNSVLPSLFPFILFTNILINSDIISQLTSIFKKFSDIISVIIIGFLCGYPMGAKITNKYYLDGKISKKQAYFLMSFVNNCNPIFILSTIGICVFNNIYIGLILCISHYLSSLIIGFIYFTHNSIIHEIEEKSNIFKQNSNKKLHKSFFEIVDESIKSSFIVLGNILAFILIFNLIFAILENILLKLNISPNIIYTLSSMFEVTNGCRLLYLNSTLNSNLVISIISFALGFSGFSIIFQIYSCIYKAQVKLTHIVKYKLLQGGLSFFITFIILMLKDNTINNIPLNLLKFNATSYFLFFSSLLFIFVYTIKKVTQK